MFPPLDSVASHRFRDISVTLIFRRVVLMRAILRSRIGNRGTHPHPCPCSPQSDSNAASSLFGVDPKKVVDDVPLVLRG